MDLLKIPKRLVQELEDCKWTHPGPERIRVVGGK